MVAYTLRTASFQRPGIAMLPPHFYGQIFAGADAYTGGHGYELTYVMDAHQAERFTALDPLGDFTYEAGMETGRFNTLADVHDAAREWMRLNAQPGDTLTDYNDQTCIEWQHTLTAAATTRTRDEENE